MAVDFWKGKRVLITGHNGFKGCWLTKWLDMLGAETLGYSLEPDTFSVYNELKFHQLHVNICGDVRDRNDLSHAIADFRPQIVFHLAAQAMVKEAAARPLYTFETNLMGTVNLLDILKDTAGVKSIVIVTSDKVYENIETKVPYGENARLGGDEPYSASKVCEEMAARAYYLLSFKNKNIGLATARASNTFGGGDHHFDRLIPYLIKANYYTKKAAVRSPDSVRPWQYILDLLRGYLTLAEKLYNSPPKYSEGWNFGPPKDELYTVGTLAQIITETKIKKNEKTFKEAKLLLINSDKSEKYLGWKPLYDLSKGLERTSRFYGLHFKGKPIDDLINCEIEFYTRDWEELR